MNLGVMGGTFDPIHYAHLFIAESARAQYHLDRVLFVPNNVPAHKPTYAVSPAHHRLAMTERATQSNPAFVCSNIEMERPGPSYSVDTLLAIKRQYPDAELYFITGIDAIAELTTWRRHSDLLALCRFIAATRPGYPQEYLQSRLPEAYLQRILPLSIPPLELSSTEIRNRVETGQPVRYLLPDSVVDYIVQNGLYRNELVKDTTDT